MLTIDIKPNSFLPKDFQINTWADLEQFYNDLQQRDLTTREAFESFRKDRSELEDHINETRGWLYIRTTTHTNDDVGQHAYRDFITNITPHIQIYSHQLDQKILATCWVENPTDIGDKIAFTRLKQAASLFRTANVPLDVELRQLVAKNGALWGAMNIILDNENLTLQQATDRLFWPNRAQREQTWRAIHARQLQDKDTFDTIFDTMVQKRHQVAIHAGYANFRDYQHDAMLRFDYTPDDCIAFHQAVKKHVVPVISQLEQDRTQHLGLDKLRPWDLHHDIHGRPALKAFIGADDLIAKGIAMLDGVDPFFGDVVRRQRDAGRLDLDSRPHKSTGGFNFGMPRSIIPFMFANTTGKPSDVNMFMHEAGHATHNILSHQLPLNVMKSMPIEMSELAAMSMEFLTFDQYHILFPDETDRHRVQYNHLKSILGLFIGAAQNDAFQHAVYLNPDMSPNERHDLWYALTNDYATNMIDRTGLDVEMRTRWHAMTHLFRTPFYYIEYAIAQIGALQLWRNYQNDPQTTIERYKNALSLGYTKPLPDLYHAAGITFDFSEKTLVALMPFLLEQLNRYATLPA